MRIVVLVRSLFCLLGLALSACALQSQTPAVAILANRDDPESMELARHYAQRRGLPDTAIIALSMPPGEQITWPEFVARIWNPFVREAVDRGWLLASISASTDPVGRFRITSARHRLDALVICRGVPLRIAHDPALYDPASNPLTKNASLQTNEASVDSELALFAADNPPIAALVPNPLFNTDRPSSFALEQIVPVGRLDGPTLADAKGLVDRALEAERIGLAGRAYLDLGGPHRRGDEWLEACLPELASLGFETDVDRDRASLRPHARFDAPALYFGWYEGNLNGPFTAPGFRFPPGAIALHIHSFSATTLRSPSRGWTGPLVAKGVTATVGNVAEPYLEFTHQPHLLLRALARGEPLGRAALYSINALSWKGIVVGDPLYRPFAVSAEEQWQARKTLPPETETYARIRRLRLLSAAGRGEETLSLGVAGMRQNPSLPLALTLAGLQLSAGDPAAARRSLAVFGTLPSWRPADHALVLASARSYQAAEDAAAGVKLVERLLAEPSISPAFRLEILRQGMAIARAALDFNRAGRWEAEIARLTAPAAAAGATRVP